MSKSDAESFMNSCRTGDISKAMRNVKEVGVNYQEVTGATGLMWAIFKGHNQLAHRLLSLQDTDVNIKSHKLGTALHWAVAARNISMIHALLAKQEIHLCIKNSDGRSALDLAIFMNSADILNLLKIRNSCPGCSLNRAMCTTPVMSAGSKSPTSLLENKSPSPSMENSRAPQEESSSSAVIKNAFDCPVCLEQMEPPKRIWQCVQGHAICEGCRHNARMVSCPTCRGPFSGRNIAMEQVAQAVFQ